MALLIIAGGVKAQPQQPLTPADSLMAAGKLDSAAVLFQQQLKGATQQKDTAVIRHTNIQLGKIWLVREQFDRALDHYLNALKYIPADHPRQLAEVYMGAGVVYSRMQDFDKAKAYLEKSLPLLQEEDMERLKVLANLGGLYMNSGDWQLALDKHRSALTLAEKLGATQVKAVLYTNLSNYYIMQKDWRQAIEHARKSLRVRDSLGQQVSVITYNNLGYALVQSGMPEEGMRFYKQALPYASLAEKKQLLYNLRGGAIAAGNYKKAVEYYDQYDAIKDSISAQQYQEKVAEISTAYETAKKQQRILLLEAENKAKRKEIRLLVIAVILFLALVSGIIYFRFKHFRTKQELERSKVKRQLLQVQLNPHFIFNALTQVQQYIYNNDPSKSIAYLHSFSRLIRLILENSDREMVPLEEEIEMLEHYLALQQSGGKAPFDFEFLVAPGLDVTDIRIPVMLLQPFVENAVIHGARERENGKITLSFETDKDYLHVRIADNGKGMHAQKDQSAASLHRSMGRKIVDQRIAEFNRANKHRIILQVEHAADDVDYPGTCVHLHIPLQ